MNGHRNTRMLFKFLDLIDWLLDHLINENRTRRTVIKKLKELHLIVNSKVSCIFLLNNLELLLLTFFRVKQKQSQKNVAKILLHCVKKKKEKKSVHPYDPTAIPALRLPRSMIYEDLEGRRGEERTVLAPS